MRPSATRSNHTVYAVAVSTTKSSAVIATTTMTQWPMGSLYRSFMSVFPRSPSRVGRSDENGSGLGVVRGGVAPRGKRRHRRRQPALDGEDAGVIEPQP